MLKLMRHLHEQKEAWFTTAFNIETCQSKKTFHKYHEDISETGAWGGTLEREVVSDLYNIDIQVLYADYIIKH